MNTIVTAAPRAHVAATNLWWAAPLAGITAAVINSVLFFAADSLGLIVPTALVQGQPLTVVPVIISSIMPAVVAGIVYALLGRFTRRPWAIFRTVALALVVLSFVNPFLGIPGITVSMGLALNLMHVVVAGAVLYFFGKYATVGEAA